MTRGLTFPQLTAGLLFGALAVCACLMPAHADTYWQLRAGQEIWRTHRVPLVDSYSFTAAGRPWPDHEWLWQALSYALYRLGGMRLYLLGGAALVVGAMAVVYRSMVGPTATRFWLLLLGFPLTSALWVLRPQIVTLFMLVLLVRLLIAERYAVLPLVFLLWANAHGGVAAGGLLLAIVTGLAVARARRGGPADVRRAVRLGVVTPLCALATALTPLGFGVWRFVGGSLSASRGNGITEWQPTLPFGPFEIGFWILALAFVGLLVARRARLRAPDWAWGDRVALAAALVTLPLGILMVRNTAMFLLTAVPAASRLLGPAFRFRAAPADAADHPRVNLALLVGISAVEALGVWWIWRAPPARLGWRPMSPAAVAAVRACPGPLYNRFYDGGFLIWFVPERPVFLDNRQDPYPPAFIRETTAVDGGAPYRPLFARYGIRCAFVPAESKMIARLGADGWRTRFRDQRWAVLAAPGGR
ncbi:MAG TPA: hypothetical protein VHO06_05980 [Polyangia bacterium]|nr:hypothetical protein [Polyangia bacterium]